MTARKELFDTICKLLNDNNKEISYYYKSSRYHFTCYCCEQFYPLGNEQFIITKQVLKGLPHNISWCINCAKEEHISSKLYKRFQKKEIEADNLIDILRKNNTVIDFEDPKIGSKIKSKISNSKKNRYIDK